MSNIPKQPEQVAKTALQQKFNEAFQLAVAAAADNFIAKRNSQYPSDPIDIRFNLTKNKISNNPGTGAQIILTFELKRYFQWNIMSRVTKEFPTVLIMEKHEQEVTFELWMKMFDEITQIGFASVTNYLTQPNHHAQEDDQQGTAKRNIQAVEDERS